MPGAQGSCWYWLEVTFELHSAKCPKIQTRTPGQLPRYDLNVNAVLLLGFPIIAFQDPLKCPGYNSKVKMQMPQKATKEPDRVTEDAA